MTNDKHPKVTGEELQLAVLKSGREQLPMRNCSICGYLLSYMIIDGQAYFDSGCNCTEMPSDPRHTSWHNVARHINIQPSIEARNRIRQDWGLPPEGASHG